MTYEDFEKKVAKIATIETKVIGEPFHWGQEPKKIAPYLYSSWSTGGISGGSCWDDGKTDNHHAYTSSDPEPEFTDFYEVLEEFCPQISFLQYKSLAAKLIETGSFSEYEYYGNCTNYAYKKVDLRALFDYLISKGWLK